MYITPEKAADTVMHHLSADSRLIVTGQIGCGKTTLARKICSLLTLTHLEIDDFCDDPDPLVSAAEAARTLKGGWVAEANVWQIPPTIWEASDFVIFLDYANWIHYIGIIRRCIRRCLRAKTWVNVQHSVKEEFSHLKIVYLYANENRRTWQKQGGITSSTTAVIRCTSRYETRRLFAQLSTNIQK